MACDEHSDFQEAFVGKGNAFLRICSIVCFSFAMCPCKSPKAQLILKMNDFHTRDIRVETMVFRQGFLIDGRTIIDLSVSILLITTWTERRKEMNREINLRAYYVAMKLVKIKRNVKDWYWQWSGCAGSLRIAGVRQVLLLFESNMVVVIEALR